jgi:hypothetical protein
VRRAAVAVAVAGCTTVAPHAPPADAPRAELRVVANALGGTIFAIARDAPGCGDGGGHLLARLQQRQPPDLRTVYLADGSPAPAPLAEVTIAADRPFTLLVQVQGLLDGWYGYGCARAVTFAPAAGARYDAVFVSEDPYRCRIDVWRVEPGRRAAPEDLMRDSPPCALRAYARRGTADRE